MGNFTFDDKDLDIYYSVIDRGTGLDDDRDYKRLEYEIFEHIIKTLSVFDYTLSGITDGIAYTESVNKFLNKTVFKVYRTTNLQKHAVGYTEEVLSILKDGLDKLVKEGNTTEGYEDFCQQLDALKCKYRTKMSLNLQVLVRVGITDRFKTNTLPEEEVVNLIEFLSYALYLSKPISENEAVLNRLFNKVWEYKEELDCRLSRHQKLVLSRLFNLKEGLFSCGPDVKNIKKYCLDIVKKTKELYESEPMLIVEFYQSSTLGLLAVVKDGDSKVYATITELPKVINNSNSNKTATDKIVSIDLSPITDANDRRIIDRILIDGLGRHTFFHYRGDTEGLKPVSYNRFVAEHGATLKQALDDDDCEMNKAIDFVNTLQTVLKDKTARFFFYEEWVKTTN